jgi:hypothetical protein
MKTLVAPSLLVAVSQGGLLLALLGSASPTGGAALPEAPPHSLKGLRLKLSPSGRYFVGHDGKPFSHLGGACRLLFQRLDRAEAEEYRKACAGKGFKVSGKAVKVRWHDSPEGTWRKASEYPHAGNRRFAAPSAGERSDWVLVLEDTAKGFAVARSAASRPQGGGPKDGAGADGRLSAAPISGPLQASKNPSYFEDAGGIPLILCGSHTWNTLQDWGTDGTVRPLDFDAFVHFLKEHGHNFTLLWYTELPRFRGLPTTVKSPPDFTVAPHPWMRTGPGNATDGGLKFDLTKFDQRYFGRLRARVKALHRAGIYVGVYLFTGEWQLRFRCRSDGYPFSGPNNVNGVDDGYRGGAPATGIASVTMTAPNAITDLQDAYVRKTIDTLNDLPNVLWIVSEEAPQDSVWWSKHLISVVRAYEKEKRYQHPVGYAVPAGPPDDRVVYDSDADWVAPGARVSPPRSCGAGKPAGKVTVNDSDHSYFGMWNETPRENRSYAWQNFTNGNQVLFMDPYLVHYPREKRNLCASPVNGIGSKPDRRWENFRANLGYILKYSRKLNLARVTPRSSLCSTRYCLAQTPAAGAEYLVYAPSGGPFTVDLSAMPSSRLLTVEWLNPATGEMIPQSPVKAGAPSQSFTPPFRGDAVLYLVDTQGRR